MNKKLIAVVVVLLILIAALTYFIRQEAPVTLKAGDTDPTTGCVITEDNGALCN